jgi:hypothetical protein
MSFGRPGWHGNNWPFVGGYLGQMRIPGLYINHTCRWLCEQCVRINYFSPRCWGQEPFEVSYSEEGVKDDS